MSSESRKQEKTKRVTVVPLVLSHYHFPSVICFLPTIHDNLLTSVTFYFALLPIIRGELFMANFCIVEMGSPYVVQAGLKLLGSSNLPT